MHCNPEVPYLLYASVSRPTVTCLYTAPALCCLSLPHFYTCKFMHLVSSSIKRITSPRCLPSLTHCCTFPGCALSSMYMQILCTCFSMNPSHFYTLILYTLSSGPIITSALFPHSDPYPRRTLGFPSINPFTLTHSLK